MFIDQDYTSLDCILIDPTVYYWLFNFRFIFKNFDGLNYEYDESVI